MIALALTMVALLDDDAALRCSANELQPLVGRTVDDAVRDEVSRRSSASRRRWIPAGSAVTQDWLPDRVNLDVDAKGSIVRIWCG